jgi:cystathionine beta-lyase/cystathionine gamma-synthase
MVWIETVSNPNLKIIDIKQVCERIRTKQPNVIVVVDNTITTPIFQVGFQNYSIK